jgi:hypothetical protein
VAYRLTANSGSFTQSGNGNYSVTTTSGAKVGDGTIAGGGVVAGFFVGDGSGLTNVAAAPTGSLSGGVPGNVPYQSGVSATSFLPIMGGGGMIFGSNTVPSTGTISGTANQITVTTNTSGGFGLTLALPSTIDVTRASALVRVDGNLTDTGSLTVTGSSAAFSATTPVTISSAAFAGVFLSSAPTGAAGVLVEATCPADTYVLSGGCNCSGGVAMTGFINAPKQTAPGGASGTAWQCQALGTTNPTCTPYVICSRLQ